MVIIIVMNQFYLTSMRAISWAALVSSCCLTSTRHVLAHDAHNYTNHKRYIVEQFKIKQLEKRSLQVAVHQWRALK